VTRKVRKEKRDITLRRGRAVHYELRELTSGIVRYGNFRVSPKDPDVDDRPPPGLSARGGMASLQGNTLWPKVQMLFCHSTDTLQSRIEVAVRPVFIYFMTSFFV